MTKRLLNYLTIILIINFLLLISSCSFNIFNRKKDKLVVEHTKIVKPVIIPCPEPTKPIYEKLDENKGLCNEENLKKVMINVVKMKKYIEGLDLTIKCYKQQIYNNNENDNNSKNLNKNKKEVK